MTENRTIQRVLDLLEEIREERPLGYTDLYQELIVSRIAALEVEDDPVEERVRSALRWYQDEQDARWLEQPEDGS